MCKVVIAGAFYPDYYLQGEIDDELAAKELSGYDPSTTVVVCAHQFTLP